MVADIAFVMAFRRLPQELHIHLIKSIAVYVSSLMDSYKSQSMDLNAWSSSLDAVVELVQVLHDVIQIDFPNFL